MNSNHIVQLVEGTHVIQVKFKMAHTQRPVMTQAIVLTTNEDSHIHISCSPSGPALVRLSVIFIAFAIVWGIVLTGHLSTSYPLLIGCLGSILVSAINMDRYTPGSTMRLSMPQEPLPVGKVALHELP